MNKLHFDRCYERYQATNQPTNQTRQQFLLLPLGNFQRKYGKVYKTIRGNGTNKHKWQKCSSVVQVSEKGETDQYGWNCF